MRVQLRHRLRAILRIQIPSCRIYLQMPKGLFNSEIIQFHKNYLRRIPDLGQKRNTSNAMKTKFSTSLPLFQPERWNSRCESVIFWLVMYVIYSFLLFIALLVYLPLYIIRAKFIRRQPLHLRERLGISMPAIPEAEHTIWLHAVSVGEVLSLQNLVQRLKQIYPDWNVCVSSLTHTGLGMALDKLPQADRIFCIPFDFRLILRRYFSALKPDVFVLVESELWPNLIREAGLGTRGRVLLINGRISSRSMYRYVRIKKLMQRVLQPISLFQVQTAQDKDYLERMGISSKKIQVSGNLKVEVALEKFTPLEIMEKKLALAIAAHRIVHLAGSTHKGEEELLLSAFAKARRKRPELCLILAPRHLDRIPEILRLSRSLALLTRLRTETKPGLEWDVLILDTMGELAGLYAVADTAFIGGSLIPWGGQNLLEPAFYGKPICFGPHMDNFAHLADIFVEAGAALQIKGKADLLDWFLLENPDAMSNMGGQAQNILGDLKGATERAVQAIAELIDPVSS